MINPLINGTFNQMKRCHQMGSGQKNISFHADSLWNKRKQPTKSPNFPWEKHEERKKEQFERGGKKQIPRTKETKERQVTSYSFSLSPTLLVLPFLPFLSTCSFSLHAPLLFLCLFWWCPELKLTQRMGAPQRRAVCV